MIGQTILHYKILEKLGEGGMGVVYKAQDTKLKRDVAIKFLPRQIAASDEDRARFKIEAQAAAALNHPNIATIHNIEEVDDELFIVMEYIDGRELKSIIEDRQLSIDDILDYAAQIAAGLQAAHKKGVTHRDIKSANIMITDEGQVKIMDFGLAKVRGGAQFTTVGTTLGTAAYMSPEQAQGLDTDHRTDIWAFGVVLYEMLTGELPFAGDYEQAVIYSILNEAPEPLSSLRSETPERLQQLVAQALAKEPAERIQTATDLLASVREVGESALVGAPRPANPRNQDSGLRYWYVAVLMGVALAILAGALYLFKTAETAIDTLAILPFANQSSDAEMAYLGDGIAETLIFKLSQLPDLKVRSLSSVSAYRGQVPDLRKVGSDLNVQAVLSGRVAVRKDKLAIVVELVDTRDNSTIWGETYNRTLADLMTVQDEISNNILSRLRLELSGETRQKVNKRYTDNAEAYQAYLKGRYFARKRNEDDLRTAIKYYRQAIDVAPRYAAAYAGLSEAHFLLGVYGAASPDESLPKAKQAAENALQIDDTLSEAHAALGVVLVYSWDFAVAEQELQRAIQLDPNNIDAHHHYSYLLSNTGRHEAAIQEAKTALQLDPLSPVMTRGLALVYFLARDYDQALKYYQDCLEINPNSLSATFLLVFVYHEIGLEAQSMALLAQYLHLIDEKTLATRIEQSYKNSGYRAAILELLAAKAAGFLTDHTAKSWLFATIGETERSVESLRKAYEERAGWLPFARVHPALDPVRSDPRYIAIMDKVFGQRQ
ncbi:MAG: protein kinase [bacterium]